jgi:hypothetical protein
MFHRHISVPYVFIEVHVCIARDLSRKIKGHGCLVPTLTLVDVIDWMDVAVVDLGRASTTSSASIVPPSLEHHNIHVHLGTVINP